MHQRCHQLMRESRPDGNSFLADKNEQYDGTTTGNRMRGFSSYLLYLAAKIPRFEEWFYLDGSACHVESVRKCAKWQSALYLLQSMEDTFSCIVHRYLFCKSWAHNRSTPYLDVFGFQWIFNFFPPGMVSQSGL